MSVRVRAAEPADLPRVRLVLVETWHHTYDGILGREKVREITSTWHAPERLAREQASPDRVLLVAERDGEIVGTASSHADTDGALVVARLYVLPRHQGAGVGGALLDALVGEAVPGAPVRLEVEPSNRRAVAWYERQGFRVVGQTTDCGRHGSDVASLVMERI